MSIHLSLLIIIGLLNYCATDQLLLVHTLARHGDRSPCYTYPEDPFAHIWTEGLEQLTELGVEQLVELGKYLHGRYENFLPTVYHKDLIYVRSTGTERTLMSAYSCMAGLFPSTLSQSSTQKIGRNLVPVHSMLKLHDHLLKMSSPCPMHKKEWKRFKRSQVYIDESMKYAHFFEYLTQHTNVHPMDMDTAWKICDPITIWHNKKFTLPHWVTPEIVKNCTNVLHWKHYIKFSTPSLNRLRGGPVVGKILANMLAKVEKNLSYKLVSYFAHDSTLAAVLSHMGVHNRLKPPLASCVIVELHSRSVADETTDKHFVRVFLRNSTTQIHPLTLPGCEFDCSLSTFNALFSHSVYAEDLDEECSVETFSWDNPRRASGIPFTYILVFTCFIQFIMLGACIIMRTTNSR